MKIKDVELKNNIFLAPMAGITDSSFRIICREYGAGLVYTEMISAKGIHYDNKNTVFLLKTQKEEEHIAVQLFGRDPDIISEVIKKIDEYPFAIVDINMGCPAPKIVKNFEGAALLKEPKLIGEIVNKASKATKKPLTIKIRKGFNNDFINAVEVAKIVEANGASAVTVHGRTREEYYSGVADWDIIRKVKEAVSIPVIGNGDIFSALDAKSLINETNCDAIMIGRGAEGNPYIFREVAHYLKTGTFLKKPTLDEIIKTVDKHIDLIIEEKGFDIGIKQMRKHVSFYTKGFENSTTIRRELMSANTKEEMINLLDKLRT